MANSSLQEIVCCMGQPVAGNPTQYMMEKAFTAAGLDLRLLTLEVTPRQLADAVRGVRAMGFRGAVLFRPHLAAVVELADELSPAARLVGEVNFLRREGERLIGDNTVGKGLLQLTRSTVDPAGRRVVVLGAGSAARAVAVEYALAGAGEIVVVNRTAERGQQLAELLAKQTNAASQFIQWVGDFRAPRDTALVVQATSIGSRDRNSRISLDFRSLAETALVADLRINPPDSQFLRDAGSARLATLDGLDVLVSQAAITFREWTGVEADRSVLHDALEEFLMV